MSKKSIILDGGIVKLQRRLMEVGEDDGARLQLARAYNVRAMHEEALEQGRRLVERDPANGEAWLEAIRSTFCLDEKRLPDLREDFLRHTLGLEDQPWRQGLLALLNFYAGEEDQSREELERLVAADGRNATAWETLGDIYFHGEDLPEAIRCLERAVAEDPNSETAFHLLGTCHYKRREAEKALFYYQKAIRLEEKFARAWISLGEFFLFEEGSLAKGLQCFGTATSINPFNWDAYFILLDYFLQAKRYPLALAECQRILDLEPEAKIRAEALNYSGYTQFQMGLLEEAEASYHRALEIDTQFASPHQNLGLLYLARKEKDQARIHFKRAIRLDPSSSWSHTKLGFIYLDDRIVEKAEDHFRQALKSDAEDHWALLGLAEICRLRRRFPEQLEHCLRAVQVVPQDGNVWNHLGIAYECNRDHPEAEKAYQKAMELDPFNRWAANNLGYLYEKLMKRGDDGDHREKAVRIWKKRLLICARTGKSVQGATRHLLKLGIPQEQIRGWLEEGSAAR